MNFAYKQEPVKGCLDLLRAHILGLHEDITEVWRYSMPFYCYKGKRFCYLWVHKKYGQPYIGIVEGKQINHPDLIIEKRARMKILLVDANKNIPVSKIRRILKEVLLLYKK